MKALTKVVSSIDWEALVEQKQTLVEVLSGAYGKSGNLIGILNLLDALQDAAEDDGIWTALAPASSDKPDALEVLKQIWEDHVEGIIALTPPLEELAKALCEPEEDPDQ